jgi:hypothetical protein
MSTLTYGSNYAYGASPYYKDDGVPVPEPIVCNDGSVVAPTTVLDIIRRALRLIGVLATGETPDGPEAADALQVMNWMIEQWTNEKLMVYYMENMLFSAYAGIGTYTIGPDNSNNWQTLLPVKIESAFCRDNSSGFNNDYKLELIPNDRYQDIFQKGILTTYPKYIHYVRSWPNGSIDLWPVPTRNYTIGLSHWHQIQKYLNLTDIICLPPGYKTALAYNLAVEMAGEYGQAISSIIQNEAVKSKAILMRVNFEPVLMSTDPMLVPRRMYNIYSDRY